MELFPPFDAFARGRLDVGDGHVLAWDMAGNPAGVPVLYLHGGPGAGTTPAFRRFFDPAFWRVVLFDQRGCGGSTPVGGLDHNTTAHLVEDIERLRVHLGISRWLVFGGSWGATLALSYGQAHPERVLGFVLRGVFLFRPHEVTWFVHGMGNFFPEAGRRFLSYLSPEERADPLAAYHARVTGPDPRIAQAAAQSWCEYEDSCARFEPRAGLYGADPTASLALARIETHYMVNNGFLAENQLLDGLDRVRALPCSIVQGRYDVICPPGTAADLARAWPGSHLSLVTDGGHSVMDPSIRRGLLDAVEGMKTRIGTRSTLS